jgi:hypothetical protein
VALRGQSVLQLRISLEEIRPVIWRRVLVPGRVRLDRLHVMFQAAMGWTDSHLHQFRVERLVYGTQLDDYPDEELDEKCAWTVSGPVRPRMWVARLATRSSYRFWPIPIMKSMSISWRGQAAVSTRRSSPWRPRTSLCSGFGVSSGGSWSV